MSDREPQKRTHDNEPPQGLSRRAMLRGIGVGSAVAAGAVIGHGVAWGSPTTSGVVSSTYPVKPYTLIKGAIETFSITERLHVVIDGFGEDVVNLIGTATFHRSDPRLAPEAEAAGVKTLSWATAVHDVAFKSLEAHGKSEVFGAVKVRNSATSAEKGQVRPNSKTLNALRAGTLNETNSEFGTLNKDCVVGIGPTVSLDAYGETLTTGSETVSLGSVVSVVPPVGDVARTIGTVGLYDSTGTKVGTLVAADIAIGPIVNRIAS